MALKRIHVFYSGYVQGIGFRYTVCSIASELGLVGWVRNLKDGRVEVICEGEEQQLRSFLHNIKKEFLARYVRDTEVSWEEPTQEFDSFGIRF